MFCRCQRTLGGLLFKHLVGTFLALVVCGTFNQGKAGSTNTVIPRHHSYYENRVYHRITRGSNSVSPGSNQEQYYDNLLSQHPGVSMEHELVSLPVSERSSSVGHFSVERGRNPWDTSQETDKGAPYSKVVQKTYSPQEEQLGTDSTFIREAHLLKSISLERERLINKEMVPTRVGVSDQRTVPGDERSAVQNVSSGSRSEAQYFSSSMEKYSLLASSTAKDLSGVHVRRRDTSMSTEMMERCETFVVGNESKQEFYSPNYPNNYPNNTNCFKVLKASPNHLLELDFRNEFHLEPSENCRFDFLEVRDGAHGYDRVVGKYCGTEFPDVITSSTRSLWLRFSSDESIEYKGFTAVYKEVPRPEDGFDPDECVYELVDMEEGFINNTDIDEERRRITSEYDTPLDCMWIIRTRPGWKISLNFIKFDLAKPNDCVSNFVDVFTNDTNISSRKKNFCGSIADAVLSDTNIIHIRYYASSDAIASVFQILFTAYRDAKKQGCKDDEFDCQDDTCIKKVLHCNYNHNCRLARDEDVSLCHPVDESVFETINKLHIIIILVMFCVILSGMCFTFLYNCTRKLIHDHRIIREHIRQSREGQLDEVGKTVMASSPRPASTARSRSNSSSGGGSVLSPHHLLRAVRSAVSGGREDEERATRGHTAAPDECYVPSAGDLLPILIGATTTRVHATETRPVPANGDAVFLRNGDSQHPSFPHLPNPPEFEDECDDLEMLAFPPPEMRDNECQTRESLFMNTNSDRSMTPPPPPPPITSRFTSSNTSSSGRFPALRPAPTHPQSSSNTSAFSTFGYTKDNRRVDDRSGSSNIKENLKDYSTLPTHHHHHHHHHGAAPMSESQRFRAEAVIEMEQASKNGEDAEGGSVNKSFSIDSTKSAPDVIVTH